MQIEFTVAQKTPIQKTLGVMTQGLLYWYILVSNGIYRNS